VAQSRDWPNFAGETALNPIKIYHCFKSNISKECRIYKYKKIIIAIRTPKITITAFLIIQAAVILCSGGHCFLF